MGRQECLREIHDRYSAAAKKGTILDEFCKVFDRRLRAEEATSPQVSCGAGAQPVQAGEGHLPFRAVRGFLLGLGTTAEVRPGPRDGHGPNPATMARSPRLGRRALRVRRGPRILGPTPCPRCCCPPPCSLNRAARPCCAGSGGPVRPSTSPGSSGARTSSREGCARPVTHLVPRERMIAGDEGEARALPSAPAGFDVRRREMSA